MQRTLLLIALLACVVMLTAQTYTIEQLVGHGVQNATAIKQELLDELSTRSSLRSSFYNFLPQASVGYDFSNNNHGNETYSSRLSISKTISLQDDDWYEYHRQYAYLAIAEMSLDDLRKQIAYSVVSLYLDVLEGQRTREILQQQLGMEEKTREQTQILYDADKRSLLDLKQSEINLIDARIAVDQQELSLRNTRQNLFHLLNMEDQGWPLQDPQLDLEAPAMTWQKPLSIRIEEENIDAAGITLRESLMQFWPNVSLSASWNYGASGPEAGDPFDTDLLEDSYTVSVGVSYDLLNWLTHGESYRRQKWSLRRQKLGLDDNLRQNKLDFEQKLADWQLQRATHDLYLQRLDLAADNYELAQEKYRLGILNFLDAEQARLDYTQAQIAANTSHFNLLRTREELNLLLSRPILGQW